MKLRHQVPSTLRNEMTRSGAVLFGPLHREIDRLFDDFSQGLAAQQKMMHLLPNIDVAESNKEIEISVEMPGLERSDVDISLEDNVLTIRGEKKMESHRDDKNVYVSERSYGTFLRTIELPAGIDSSKVTAAMSDGVLKITVPKPANVEAKKIEVKEGKNGKPSSRAQ